MCSLLALIDNSPQPLVPAPLSLNLGSSFQSYVAYYGEMMKLAKDMYWK